LGLNLGSVLQASAALYPERTALRWNEISLRYAELDRAARGVATSLRARGVAPGDRVALSVPNLPDFTIAYFGILYAGAVVVPLNVLFQEREVAYHLSDAGARVLIAHPLFGAAARGGAAQANAEIIWAGGNESPTVSELAQAEPLRLIADTRADATAVILYTSGTTGKPKGAELTHANLFVNCSVVVPKMLPVHPDVVMLATLPLFHSFGQTCIQNACIAGGATFTLLPRFTPNDALAIMERDRVTHFAGVPTMYFALLHHEPERAHDLSSLKYCLSGGAPMPVDVMKAFEARYSVPILEGYGLSETSPVASFNVLDRPRKAGSIGYPVWGVEMMIASPEGLALPDGESGEIWIRGHNVMKGYLGRPEANAEALRDGWFRTGDIGVRDPDGSYRIVDRVKDMILRGGFNVYPREIEEVLYGHAAVLEAAVIGIPHASHGEEVKAFVVRKPESEIGEDELIAWSKERLAAYKYPREIQFVDALPKGPTGKILKRELR
jgi:long-chain acyl-CoA synthetase